MQPRNALFLLVLFGFCTPGVLPARETLAEPPRPLTLDDFGAVKEAGGPKLSRDGRHAAYALEGRLYVVPLAGGEPRQVTTGGSSASDPYWSRDGRFLYFISDRTGTNQVWKLPLESFGEAVQVTKLERGIDAIDFSADERRLLLSYEDGEEGDGADDDGVRDPWVVTRLHFKEDAGAGYLTRDPSNHLYVYEVSSGTLTRITSGRYAETEAAWSPDGTRVVFVSNRGEEPDAEYRADLWIVPAEPDAGAGPLMQLTDDEYEKSSPRWSPDGRYIAYLSFEDGVYGIGRLTIVPADGGEPRILGAELDRWVRDIQFSDDGRYIYFTFENHGGRHLARIRLRDERIERLIEGDRVVSAYDVDARGNVAARIAEGNRAAELYAGSRGRLDRLTELTDEFFASRELGAREKVSYTLDDGTVVEAFVTRPVGFREGRRYPTILKIHGGPVAQFTWGYDFATQYFAANGYVVVEPNPRGSTGRGQEFVRAIYRTWGITEYPDVIGAIDHVIELGYADPERLFVTGYSYGGYMTNVVITRTDRFRAAASGAGHSLIAANFGHDIYQKWYNWELGLPFENREAYDRLSPLIDAGNVSTPTIFLGGREDWNVPILNAELFYQTLRTRGVATQLVVYPDTHHGHWTARYSKDYLERIVDWFGRYGGTSASRP